MAGVAKVGVAVVERAGAVVPAIAVLEAFGTSCLSTKETLSQIVFFLASMQISLGSSRKR